MVNGNGKATDYNASEVLLRVMQYVGRHAFSCPDSPEVVDAILVV